MTATYWNWLHASIIEGWRTPLGHGLKKDKRARDDVRERSTGETQKHTAQKHRQGVMFSVWK